MSTPEDHEGLPVRARIALLSLGGKTPEEPSGKGRKTLTARVEGLGWKILPIPNFWQRGMVHSGDGTWESKAFISFDHPHEWLIVPPEGSPIRARKARGRIVAIREAYRLAMYGEPPGSAT